MLLVRISYARAENENPPIRLAPRAAQTGPVVCRAKCRYSYGVACSTPFGRVWHDNGTTIASSTYLVVGNYHHLYLTPNVELMNQVALWWRTLTCSAGRAPQVRYLRAGAVQAGYAASGYQGRYARATSAHPMQSSQRSLSSVSTCSADRSTVQVRNERAPIGGRLASASWGIRGLRFELSLRMRGTAFNATRDGNTCT